MNVRLQERFVHDDSRPRTQARRIHAILASMNGNGRYPSRDLSSLLGRVVLGSSLIVGCLLAMAAELALQGTLHASESLSSGRVLRGFPAPGDKPEGLAWDGQSLWCNNFNEGWLFKLDPVDGRIQAQYRGQGLPANPEGLAWDGENLWTCDWHTGVIVKVRERVGGMEVLGTFPKPADSGPNVGLEWDGSSLWLTCWPDVTKGLEFGQLYRLDPATAGVLERHILPVRWIEDLAWDGRYLWSADWLSGIGFAIDPATGDTLHTFSTPGPNPVGTAWDGTNLWITDTERDSIWVLDLADPTPVQDTSWGALKALFRRP